MSAYDDLRAAVEALHRVESRGPNAAELIGYCRHDGQRWPCKTIALLATPAPEAARVLCDDCGVPVGDHGGEMDDCPARDLPTTVQADRDAGQVRLTEAERHRLYLILASGRISIKECGEFHDRIVAEVEAALAARQFDPDATKRVQWSIRYSEETVAGQFVNQQDAQRYALRTGHGTVVHRTVATGEWTEVGE